MLTATQRYITAHGPKSARLIAMRLDPSHQPTQEELTAASKGRVLIQVNMSGSAS